MKHVFEHIHHFSQYVTRYPKLMIALCLAMTAMFATQLPKLTLDTSVKGQFPSDFPAKIDLDELEEVFGGSEIVLLGIKAENIYAYDCLETIQQLSEEIEELEEVEDVTSLFTVNDIVATEDGMEVNDLIEEIPTIAEEAQSLRRRIQSNALFWKSIISEDETTTAIVATIIPEAKDDVVYEKFQAIVTRETQQQMEHSYSPPQLYLGGMPIMRATVAMNIQGDMKKFLPIGMGLMITLLYFSFRSLRGVLLPFTVVVMSLICTFGLMAGIGKPITVLGVLLPAMLIAIANDYSIHLVARYYEDAKEHIEQLTPRTITLNVMTRLGIPILLADVTTVAGFDSLLTHIMPPAEDLGLLAAFGIIMAFLLSMTFVPAWLALLPIPRTLTTGKRQERLGRILHTLSAFITRYPVTPKALFLVGVCLALISATGLPKIVVDTNELNYFEDNHPLVVSTNLINEKLGGAMTIDLVFEDDIKDPDVLKTMQAVQEYMNTLPHIGKTMSLVDSLKQMNQAMHEDDPTYYTIPATRDLVAQYLLLYSMSGDPEDFDDVVDYDYRKGHLIGRVNVLDTTNIANTVKESETFIIRNLENIETPNVESVTGFSVLFKELIPLIITGQIRSLLLSLVIIFLIGAFAFRSLTAGLFTIYPISVAMLMVFGLMGYHNITLNVAKAMLSSILIGVGVDYTIHFLYHYREEIQQAGLDPHQALEVTLTTSGKGIIYNALSVVVGFSVLMFSNFLPVYFFGWLLTFSILACLIGALTLLPAAILVFKPKFIFHTTLRLSKRQYPNIPTRLEIE